MEFKTDIQIAQECVMAPITEIADKAGIEDKYLEQYGKYKAKIDPAKITGKNGKLILVTAMTPTPAGEGKTTTTVGLADGLKEIGKKMRSLNCSGNFSIRPERKLKCFLKEYSKKAGLW